MSGQFRMTPDMMRTRAGEVNNQGQEYENVINRMQNIINELQTEWEGKASRSFYDQFEALKPSFNKMRELFVDLSTQLNQTADAVQQMDEHIANQFGVR